MAHRRLRDLLEPALARLPPGPVAVAFSGGLDSTVLLHGLAALDSARRRGLRAIHVDHGLQDDSADWAQHCRSLAESLGVACSVLQVDVPRARGLGLEASARRARHSTLHDAIGDDEILAFAHHRDDQAETVLLKMLRGAGPEGLAAMRAVRRFGRGQAWRPLLALPRAALRSYAEHHRLGWVNDPSNADTLFDRNYLRLDVLPRIRKRWPEADASITQSASWVRAAADYIDTQARHALAQVQGGDPATLRFREWLQLPDALRDPVLRHWLRGLDLGEPNQHQVGELVRQLAEAGEDRLPCVRWPGAELRRYRDLVYALAPLRMVPPGWEQEWSGDSVELPATLGGLRLVDAGGRARPPSFDPPWHVRFRRGGETLRMRGGHRDLRDLFQGAGIPPWQRGRIPLVFDAGGTLHAVADLWLGERADAWLDHAGLRLQWVDAH